MDLAGGGLAEGEGDFTGDASFATFVFFFGAGEASLSSEVRFRLPSSSSEDSEFSSSYSSFCNDTERLDGLRLSNVNDGEYSQLYFQPYFW